MYKKCLGKEKKELSAEEERILLLTAFRLSGNEALKRMLSNNPPS